MPKYKRLKTFGKVVLWIVLALFLLFFILGIVIYLPPVQQYVANRVAHSLSETTGTDVRVRRVRLSFPLNLDVQHVTAVDHGDTLLHAQLLRLDVEFWPLLSGKANVSGIELYVSTLDTRSFIGNTRLKGTVGRLTANVRSADWRHEQLHIPSALLRDADLCIALSDTAQADTTETPVNWDITVARATLQNVKARIALPGTHPDSALYDGTTIWAAARLTKAELADGHFDLGAPLYAFRSLDLTDGAVAYTPKGTDGTWTPGPRRTYTDAMPALSAWTPFKGQAAAGQPLPRPDITTDGSTFLMGTRPFDPDNVVVTNLNLTLDTLSYNAQGQLRMGLTRLSLTEQSGLSVDNLSGPVYLDSHHAQLPALQLRTPHSAVSLAVDLPFSAFQSGNTAAGALTFNLKADLGADDVRNLARGYLPADLLRAYPDRELRIDGAFSGTLDRLGVSRADVTMPDVFTLKTSGHLTQLGSDSPAGNLSFSASLGRAFPGVYRRMLPDVAQSVSIPADLTARGTLAFAADDYRLRDTRLTTGGGVVRLNAAANTRTEAYAATVHVTQLPLQRFVAGLDATPFNGSLTAKGRGFDFISGRAKANVQADISSFAFAGYDLSNLQLQSVINGPQAQASFTADNPTLQATGRLDATLGKTLIDGTLTASLTQLDLQRAGVADSTLQAGGSLRLNFETDRNFTAYKASGAVSDIFVITAGRGFNTDDIRFSAGTGNDSTYASVESGDLVLRLGTRGDINRLTPRLGSFATLLGKQLDERRFDLNALRHELPVMDFHMEAARQNPASNFLRLSGYQFRSTYIDVHTHPVRGITGVAHADSLTAAGILLDRVDLSLQQDSLGITFNGLVKNDSRRNPNKFTAKLGGHILPTGADAAVQFFDVHGDTGINLGVSADLLDNGFNLKFHPEHPVVAYRTFTINPDNFVFLGQEGQIRADIDLLADDGTGLKVYSAATDSANDITLSVNNINLNELSNVLPYMPRLSGKLSGDFHVFDDHRTISAMGALEANDFAYEGTPLGRLGADITYLPTDTGEHYAAATVNSAGRDVLEAEGTYNDQLGTFNVSGNLHDFPLPLLNAFLDGTDTALSGQARGNFTLTGTAERPVLNGSFAAEAAHIYSAAYGFDFRMDEKPVAIADSRITFADYNLYSTGSSPLVINGNIDLSELERITLDFTMNADNFKLIDAKKNRSSLVFGKVYTDFTGTMKGTLDDLSIRGKLDVLDKTNVTYILKDSPLSIDQRLSDLVQFVSFEDSLETDLPATQEATSNFDLALAINVSDAAHFHCYLSDDGQDYVDIEGGGNLTFRITPQGDMRLTGRLTAQSGEMKYELPVIPLRTFKLVEGSTVEFTGDPANPTLDIQAKERMKVLVTENEQQRNVAFDVGVAISKPLDQMGLEFTIEAPEDLSIQNQLASMSAEQRNKAAVAMMATGMYITDTGSTGSGFKANNALNAFLQSEIQNIAGNALKTVDISLGVETGTSTTGTQTTDYAFQFSKRFWGDRIRVIIGGRVSAGKNADNSAESLINNVSVEYKMNAAATRYLRVFYDRDTQDPLEGQLTKTGAGYSLRRKASHFGNLLLFWRKNEEKNDPNK